MFSIEQWLYLKQTYLDKYKVMTAIAELPGKGAELTGNREEGFRIRVDPRQASDEEAVAHGFAREHTIRFCFLHELAHLELGHYPSDHPETQEETRAANEWASACLQTLLAIVAET